MGEGDRKSILARRARFVAAAIAAAGLSSENCAPQACLSEPAGPEVFVPESDGGIEPATEDSGSARADAESRDPAALPDAARPRMCLSDPFE
jgi:hypothetical protein